MRYCTRCKRIYFNNENGLCPLCGRQMTDDPNILSPVYVLTANGFELERVRSVLDSEGIAYTVNEARHDAGIQILNSAPPENCDVYVTLSEYERAVETLKGSGAISDDILVGDPIGIEHNARHEGTVLTDVQFGIEAVTCPVQVVSTQQITPRIGNHRMVTQVLWASRRRGRREIGRRCRGYVHNCAADCSDCPI